MSPFGLKFAQMILHTETSKLMYNWSFLFVVLHKPTLLPSTFKPSWISPPIPKLQKIYGVYSNAFECLHGTLAKARVIIIGILGPYSES